MAALWTSAITGAWGVVADLLGDFMPVIIVGLGLTILGALWVAFSKR